MNQQYHNQQFEGNGVAGQRSCEYCLVGVIDQSPRKAIHWWCRTLRWDVAEIKGRLARRESSCGSPVAGRKFCNMMSNPRIELGFPYSPLRRELLQDLISDSLCTYGELTSHGSVSVPQIDGTFHLVPAQQLAMTEWLRIR